MTIGIYVLKFKGTDKVYIGQSNFIEKRFTGHKRLLELGLGSTKLQEAYNIYGIPTMEILCECTLKELDDLETEAISIYNSRNNGFNSTDGGNTGSKLYGPDAGQSKYSREDIIKCFELLVNTTYMHKEIADITNVSINVINQISSGARHTWLAKEFPEMYEKLISLKYSKKSASRKGIVYPKIKSPTNEIFTISNLREFCRLHSIDPGHLGKVLKGIYKQHKGWTLA